MGFFDSKPKPGNLAEVTEATAQLETRWLTFLSKLEEKVIELTEGLRTEGKSVKDQDVDLYKRAYYRFKMGITGQIGQIRDKARNTWQSEILGKKDQLNYEYQANLMSNRPVYDIIWEWGNRCDETYRRWEDRIHQREDLAIAEAEHEDFEAQYQTIQEDHDKVKSNFCCTQCGAPLEIDRIYTISTYITCPQCQTQNTFMPSSTVRGLELIAKPLAEQRNRALYNTYRSLCGKTEELFTCHHQAQSKLKSDQAFSPRNVAANRDTEVFALKESFHNTRAQRDEVYLQYLRNVYDALHEILPDMKAQNEKVLERHIADYKARNM